METQRLQIDQSDMNHAGYLVPFSRPGAATLQLGDFFNIGRDSSCHLVLNDPFVSSRHARIEKRSGFYVLRDLHSRNGTFLNGSRVTEATLTANDRVRFGETVYVFSETATDTLALSSRNGPWSEQLLRLPAFATTDFPVLITGPSGSGKEILARAVHRNSARARGPFISINCSALSESLIESELFGHVKGSFTGAANDRKGAFESARGGTLFLDELGDLPVSLQPKLLRALENREIRPVGSDKTIETDVRIIAATHKDLVMQVRYGKFREDLYYRLNVCHLRPPALRDRMEDFDDLFYMFAKQYRVRFSFASIQRLKEHAWPGNIRELKNIIARASAYFPSQQVQPDDLGQILEPAYLSPNSSSGAGSADQKPLQALQASVLQNSAMANGPLIKEIEKEMIMRRLVANRGNQRKTAHDLGLPKSTLHDRIRAYSIDIEALLEQETKTADVER